MRTPEQLKAILSENDELKAENERLQLIIDHVREEIEIIEMNLKANGVPTTDTLGTLSLWGRITRLRAMPISVSA